MNKKDKETRKQKRLERLGGNHPTCVICGEDRWQCIEEHHISGRAHGDDLAKVCKNCHSILTDDQKDHPSPAPIANREQSIGYLLIGLADLFALLVSSLRQHGEYLIQVAKEKPE